uniref:Uncharacterized protein n=1 Tax=Pithovirus LCPAC101 TaxID=2506586 RepID=A0A481Z502_9VIRU|nr:MAG: hypothetical protein LCPAC101_00030 [Pithovirus LCPAC101]
MNEMDLCKNLLSYLGGPSHGPSLGTVAKEAKTKAEHKKKVVQKSINEEGYGEKMTERKRKRKKTIL